MADDLKNIVDPTLADPAKPVTDEVIPDAVEMLNKNQDGKEDKDDQKDQERSDDKTEEITDEVKNQKTDEPESDETEIEPSEQSAESKPSEPSEETSQPSESSEPSQPSQPSQPSKPDPKGAHWYVVHTYSGHEAKVAVTLKQRIDSQKIQDKILDILVPTQEKIEIKEGKKNTIKEKIFPGYILIRMVLDDISWLAVRTTPGITSFVGNANKPTPLSEAEVETIKRFMSMEAPKFKTAFAIGEAVKIIEGPFAEFLGSISEIDDEKGKLKVMVSIFGRETPVELDFLQVNKL